MSIICMHNNFYELLHSVEEMMKKWNWNHFYFPSIGINIFYILFAFIENEIWDWSLTRIWKDSRVESSRLKSFCELQQKRDFFYRLWIIVEYIDEILFDGSDIELEIQSNPELESVWKLLEE